MHVSYNEWILPKKLWLIFMEMKQKTSPKGFSASQCDVGNRIFSKSCEFFGNIFEIFFEIFWEYFGNFGGIFWGILCGILCGILWEFFIFFLKSKMANPKKRRTAWRPYRLSHINALCINTHPRPNPWNCCEKYWGLGLWKTLFF